MEDLKLNTAGNGRKAENSSAASALAGQNSKGGDSPEAAQFLQLIQNLLSGAKPVVPQIDLNQLPLAAAAPLPPPVKDEPAPAKAKSESDDSEEHAVDTESGTKENCDNLAAKLAQQPVEAKEATPQVAVQAAAVSKDNSEQSNECDPVDEGGADLAALQAQFKSAQTAANQAAGTQGAPVQAAVQAAGAVQGAMTKVAEVQAAAAQTETAKVETPAVAEQTPVGPTETTAAVTVAPEVKSAVAPKPQQVTADDVEKYYRSIGSSAGEQSAPVAQPAVRADFVPEQGRATAATQLPQAAAQAAEAATQSLRTQIKVESGQLQGELGQGPRIDAVGRMNDAAGADLIGNRSQTKSAKAVEKMLESNSAKLVEKIRQMLQNATEGQTGNSLSLKFDPPELGQMTLKVTQRAEQIYARITPESKEVESMVRDNASQIINMFVANGAKAENVHLTIGETRAAGHHFGGHVSADDSRSGSGAENRGAAYGSGRLSDHSLRKVEPAVVSAAATVETGWVA